MVSVVVGVGIFAAGSFAGSVLVLLSVGSHKLCATPAAGHLSLVFASILLPAFVSLAQPAIDSIAPAKQTFTALGPANWCRSLKSVALSGLSAGNMGKTITPPTAFAVPVASVRPGLPSVWWSSSAATISAASGYSLRSDFATGSRLPLSNATATGCPVAS